MAFLSSRLQALFDIACGPELWDIGCDHGRLAAANYYQRKFSRVVSVDASAEVVRRLRSRFHDEYGIPPQVKLPVLCSRGQDVSWREVSGTVVMAGFGGQEMISVLQSVPQEYRPRIQWVLSPHHHLVKLTEFVQQEFLNDTQNPWRIHPLLEKGRDRSIFYSQRNFISET